MAALTREIWSNTQRW